MDDGQSARITLRFKSRLYYPSLQLTRLDRIRDKTSPGVVDTPIEHLFIRVDIVFSGCVVRRSEDPLYSRNNLRPLILYIASSAFVIRDLTTPLFSR